MPSHELENAEALTSRLPSPRREEMPNHEFENAEALPSRPSSPIREEMMPALDDNRASTDVEDSSDESEPEDPRSTRRKRARSLDSARKSLQNKKVVYLNPKKLSTEQEKAVNTAASLLTQEQKDCVQRRQDKVATQHKEASPNEMDAGTSRKKGKAIDPREWGNAGIDPEEMDIRIQEAMFDAYQKCLMEAKGGHGEPKNASGRGNFILPAVARHRSVTSPNNAQVLEAQRASSRPAAQLVPDSSLGAALGNIARMIEEPGDPDDPYDDSSDYNDSNYSRSTRSRDSSRSRRRRRRHSKRRTSKKRRHRSRRGSKSSIKPIPPKDYDGAADTRAYHRFVMEGEAYLRDGKVQRERQIRILAHYLDGKAYHFYMQKVASDDPNNWNLHKFFTELFNFCFPVDYRQQMRVKLENFNQKKGQTVSEFVFELQELFSMVGAMPEDMKVVKLWYSLSTRTQRAMWRDGLHPDSSTWDKIVAKAEVIEIADSILDRRDGARATGQKNWPPNNNLDDRRNAFTASRSVTYTNRDRNNDRSQGSNAKNDGQVRQN